MIEGRLWIGRLHDEWSEFEPSGNSDISTALNAAMPIMHEGIHVILSNEKRAAEFRWVE